LKLDKSVNRNLFGRYGVEILELFAGPGLEQSPTTQVRRIKAAPRRLISE